MAAELSLRPAPTRAAQAPPPAAPPAAPEAPEVAPPDRDALRTQVEPEAPAAPLAKLLFRVPCGWEGCFERCRAELLYVQERLRATRYLPDFEDIFRVFDFVRPAEIRVVIVGQDPYPGLDYGGRPVATGVPFAVRRGTPVTASLRNIYADMAQTVPGFVAPNHGDLTRWMRQGVFLLNSHLTTPASGASSLRGAEKHAFWAGVVVAVVECIQEASPNAVFVLWGEDAKDIKKSRVLRNTIVCFEACHPSGRNGARFVGMGTLQAVNEEFEKRKEPLIDWRL